jgi:putative acetyltransferase
MIIRDEQEADRAAVRRVIAAAFVRSVEGDLVERLRDDGDGVVSLVAVEADAVIGYVMFSRMVAPFRALALAPVAVLPERQRAGIGSDLIRYGLERVRSARWDGVFVLGDPRYYRRFGFDPALACGFASPYAGPHLMACALGPALPVREGTIAYASAFDGLT